MSDVLDTFDLNANGCAIASVDYGSAPHSPITRPGYRRQPGSVVGHDSSGWRQVRYTIEVQGTSEDDLRAKIDALRAKLPITSAKNLVVTRYGAGSGRTLVAVAVTGDLAGDDSVEQLIARWGGFVGMLSFTLLCEPYAYGAAVTHATYDGGSGSGITAPCLVDLGTLLGDYPAPLTLEFAANSTDFHSLWCGRLAPGSALAIGDLRKQGEALTWTAGSGGTMTTGSPTGAEGSSAEKYNHYNAASAPFTETAIDEGDYLPLVRGCISYVTDTGYFHVNNGPDTGVAQIESIGAGTSFVETALRILDFDRTVRLPSMSVRAAVASTSLLKMQTSNANSGHEVYMDWMAFLPASWGWFGFRKAGGDVTKLRVEADGSVYADDTGGFAGFRGRPIEAVGATKLMVLADTVTPTATTGLKLTASYTPRYGSV
jgi:hypothetical protein